MIVAVLGIGLLASFLWLSRRAPTQAPGAARPGGVPGNDRSHAALGDRGAGAHAATARRGGARGEFSPSPRVACGSTSTTRSSAGRCASSWTTSWRSRSG